MEIACRSAFQFWKVLWATSSHELGLLPLWSERYCKGQHGPLFSLLEAVEVGNCNSTACRWRSWPGLWLLLACGGAMWSVSYPVIYLHFAFNSKMEGGKKKRGILKLAMQSLWCGVTECPTESAPLHVLIVHILPPIPHAHMFQSRLLLGSEEQTPPCVWPALSRKDE